MREQRYSDASRSTAFYDNQGHLLAVGPIWQAGDYQQPTTPLTHSGAVSHATAVTMHVSLMTALDEGWLTFDTIRLTSLSAPLSARPEQYHKLAAQVSGQLNSANGGRLFVKYSNGTIGYEWRNAGVFNGSQNVNGNFTTPSGINSFQVGTEVVLDKGYLAFSSVKLTAYSDAIGVTANDTYQFNAQVMGELQAGLGQGGRMLALYQNGAGQSAGQDLLWQNPVDYHGPFQVDETFTANAGAVTMRLALEVNLDAGYLVFSDLALQHQVTGISIIQRTTYSVAGQSVAVKVAGDPDNGNNGLFYTYSDHLGSTSAMRHPNGSITQTKYLPFGGYRGGSGGNPITDRGYTGHKHNDSLGLIYMNARYYVIYINRFLSADSIVPDPTNPQSYNRYSYARNSPLNRIDPTGHVDCNLLDGGADTQACNEAKIIRTNAGAMSTPCNNCPGYNTQFGDMQAAYNVFVGLEQEMGRSVTYQEVLAIVAFHEFGKQIRNDDEYNVALEAMGRQFYNFCGPSSVCQGDELWKFLGAQQSWTKANPVGLAEELRNGIIEERDFTGAQRVLNQPSYDPANTTTEQMRSNWRSGSSASGVPFTYGNYSMYTQYGIDYATLRERGIDGINGNTLTTSYLNKPHVNGLNGNGYLVVTLGQHYCIIGTGPCQ